ncbi:protein ALUMINUM SENSITIVE 3 [Selaginella moellendorffii]|uniref:protein ALUMINUM SENSITIVE 3 n=1 Tax=Selaginella moellendorffii TaxID=88036 RepID=UPI000D1CBDF6|nr:protein ALUMINUM SENSITIVE 3 [Selaginella moellendorffii]|eukprot:XP_024534713.1 protein ALUMINUM SENSITIVE 3 [Selaginella moellendorffii]
MAGILLPHCGALLGRSISWRLEEERRRQRGDGRRCWRRRRFGCCCVFHLPSLATTLKESFQSPECRRLVGTFVPVALAVAVSHKLGIGFEGDILVSIFRSSIQLVGLGYALKFIFEGEKIYMCSFAILFMILVSGHTAGKRSKELPKSRMVATLSLAVGAAGTLALMLLLRVYEFKARYIVPTAGYVIGNSMSIVGTTLERLRHDIYVHQGQIELALALGATPAQAVHPYIRRAILQGMGPIVDSLKTVGLVSMPGSMTGMLMGGSSPLEAVQMQIQVLYMLLGASALSCLFACSLGWRVLFSKNFQLQFDDTRVLS